MNTTAYAPNKLQPFPAHALLIATILFATIVGTASTLLYANGKPQPQLPIINLSINDTLLVVEVATDDRQRQRGLSYRTELGENKGMLFVYKEERPLLFTMRETLISLSIAFISEDWIITEILEMTAGARENYPSQSPAKYALEVNPGWFSRQGIKPGDKVEMQ